MRRLAFGMALAFALPAAACPFCAKLGKTLSDLVAEADAVAFGRFLPSAADGRSLTLDAVVKAPAGFPTASLPLAKPVALADAGPRLVFLKKTRAGYVVAKATAREGRAAAEYLTALAACKTRRERVAHWFPRLLDPIPEIADDAYKSLAKLYAAEIAVEHAVLDAPRLRQWLQRGDLHPERAGLLALLLGLCGGPDDARFLAALAKQPPARLRPALDGILGGWCALDFAAGTDAALAMLNDAAAPLADRHAARAALAFALAELPRVDPEPLLARALPAAADERLLPDLLILFRQQAFAGAQPLALRTLAGGQPAARVAAARYLAERRSPAARTALATFRQTERLLAAEADQAPPFIPDAPRIARR